MVGSDRGTSSIAQAFRKQSSPPQQNSLRYPLGANIIRHIPTTKPRFDDMKTLFLLRHAKSSWDHPDLSDFDRPLAERGIGAAMAMADYLAREQLRPDLILCSAARRARETMELVQAAWGFSVPVHMDRALYDAGPGDLLQRLRGLGKKPNKVMAIGHNPTMEFLALDIVGDGPKQDLESMGLKYPTGALALFTLEGKKSDWKDLDTRTATLVRFVKPRDL